MLDKWTDDPRTVGFRIIGPRTVAFRTIGPRTSGFRTINLRKLILGPSILIFMKTYPSASKCCNDHF